MRHRPVIRGIPVAFRVAGAARVAASNKSIWTIDYPETHLTAVVTTTAGQVVSVTQGES
jgi:hypothetical protein